MWSFRVRGPAGAAATLEISPEAQLSEFCDLTARKLGLVGHENDLTFRCGFPPRMIVYEKDDLVKSYFSANDTVVVATSADASGANKQAKSRAKQPAAAAASKRTPKKAPAVVKPPPPKKSGIYSLHGSNSGRAGGARAPAASKRKIPGQGHRLTDEPDDDGDDDDQAAEAHVEQPRKYRRIRALNLTSEEEIGSRLVEAVSGNAQNRTDKFFRSATRKAVDYQYQIALANARLKAALSKKFEIIPINRVQRASHDGIGPAEMRVKFQEGVRKWKEETVELLQPVELQATLKYVMLSGGETGREMLKPFNMAQCSPRVFWNLARLYNGDIEAGLADLLPDLDWSFLNIRTRALSKKAQEAKVNEEHWKRWKKLGVVPDKNQNQDEDADLKEDEKKVTKKAKAIEKEVGSAVTRVESAREAMARAAQARFEISAQSANVVETFKQELMNQIEETDAEEVIEEATTVYCDECGKSRILTIEEAAGADVDATYWTCAKLANVNRSGSCDDVDDEIEQVAGTKVGKLLQRACVFTRKNLADASALALLKLLVCAPDEELKSTLERIIEEVRLDEVNDMMQEIVGSEDVVQLLELQKLGTPADLLLTPADLIVEAVNAIDTKSEHTLTIEDVNGWQDRAEVFMHESKWLREWRTF